MNTAQNLFAVFFAISWGFVASVQSRWKMFPWAEFVDSDPRPIRRLMLSMLVLNALPFLYFVGVFVLLRKALNSPTHEWDVCVAFSQTIGGILPAFAAFGFYRVWVGVVQMCPRSFYRLRDRHELQLVTQKPYWKCNLIVGVAYILLSLVSILFAIC